MTKNNLVGIIDEPVKDSGNDNLDINVHANSLRSFIEKTSTPITVGIQGEWGSGKTSLINSIYSDFDQDSQIKQIWINSWEYSLLSSPEEALLKIINKIIDELIEADKNESRKDKIQKGAKKIFSGALRIGAQAALGKEAVNVANELLEGEEASIGALRNQLKELVVEIANRSKNPYKKIIIYVDDLDRIEPKNAVSILELLKNIFNVPRCVFILAIDYQVVVKGLEHKFGKQNAQNEWEFRAFFDKIIQLPFMMPMGQYNIGKYVNSLLVSIGFIDKEGLDDDAIRQIILQTIGGNPRSIKRLVNSVSLIQIFVETRNNKLGAEEDEKLDIEEEDLKFLMFSLVCLQIAFPQIYSLLSQEPDFQSWDEKFAFKQTNGAEERISDTEPESAKKIFDQEFAAAKATSDFDEAWEEALYRICYIKPRLKPRVIDISKFLTYIKDELLSKQTENLGSIISFVLRQTSVTSVESTDKGQPPLPEREGAYKRRILDGLDHWILDKQTNHPSFEGEKEQIFQILFEDISKNFKEIKFLFAGWMTTYVAKHKFVGCGPSSSKSNFLCQIAVLSHFKHNWGLPIFKDKKILTEYWKPFKKGDRNHNQLRGKEGYNIWIPDIATYNKNKKEILYLVSLSYDLALNHWKERLRIIHHKGTILGKGVNIVENMDEMFKFADETFVDNSFHVEV